MTCFNTIIMFLLVLAPIAVMGYSSEVPMHPIDYCTNYHMNMPFNVVDYTFAPIILIIIFSIMFVMLGFVVPTNYIKYIEYGIVGLAGIIILSFTLYPLVYGNIHSLFAGMWKVAKVLMVCIH